MQQSPNLPPVKNAATFRKKKARKLALHIDPKAKEVLLAIEASIKN